MVNTFCWYIRCNETGMLKLHVQNKPLFLVDEINEDVNEYLHRRETMFIDELNPAGVRTMLQELEKPEYYAGVYMYEDPYKLLEAFKAELTVIQAAGGLVYTEKSEFLLIFRRGKWDLPKGKLDEGEDLEQCAIREIKEETGADNLMLEKPLHISYHTYHERGKHILKESHWYLIKTPTAMALQAQTEEDIEKCEWVSSKDLNGYLSNMHASIIDVINIGLKELRK